MGIETHSFLFHAISSCLTLALSRAILWNTKLVKAKSHLTQCCVFHSTDCAAQGSEMGPVCVPCRILPEPEV